MSIYVVIVLLHIIVASHKLWNFLFWSDLFWGSYRHCQSSREQWWNTMYYSIKTVLQDGVYSAVAPSRAKTYLMIPVTWQHIITSLSSRRWVDLGNETVRINGGMVN